MYKIYHETSKIGLISWNPWSWFGPEQSMYTKSGSGNPPHSSLLATERTVHKPVPEICEAPKDPLKLVKMSMILKSCS